MGIAMLEPSLPLWMLDTMNAPKWQQGGYYWVKRNLLLEICGLNRLCNTITSYATSYKDKPKKTFFLNSKPNTVFNFLMSEF